MYRFKLKEIEVGDTEIRGGKKSTVTDIDPETGAISWDVADAADFSSTYKALQKAKDFLDTLEKEGKAKDDTTIDKFSEQIADLFNEFRTHVRKEYPKEYERVSRLKETALSDKLIEPFDKALKSGEIGLTKNKELIDKITQLMKGLKEGHGLDQGDLDYLQFIADKNPDDTKLEKIIKFLTKSNILVDKTKDLSKGKEVEEGLFDKKLDSSIATILKKEISDILKKNPNFKPIDIARVLNPKDPELLLTRFNFVNEEDVEEGEGMGYLTPRAFGKMKNNVYTSQYGYKLVPKKIKGSGLEVKQLFEYSDFQEGRISGFDKVEEKVNAISILLSNAKNETVKFYNENPGSYAVVYSTDMVNELLDDIAEMLKQSK